MSLRWKVFAASMLFALATCGSDEHETELAVRNGGNAAIDASVSDGETELSFAGIAAGTTSTFQSAKFDALSDLTVSVGAVTSTIDLTRGERNVVDVGADGRVAGVTIPISGGGEGGW